MNGRVWGAATMTPPTTEPPKTVTAAGAQAAGAVTMEGSHIWFYKSVSQASVQELAVALHKTAINQRVQAAQIGLPEPLPIHLHIHSYGGDVFAGFAAADAVLQCPVPVHTHIEGGAASAATLFSVCGAYRTIGANAFILIHQLSSVFWGKYEEMKDEMQNYDLLMAQFRRLYQAHTKLPAKQIDEILKKDLWFDAAKALKCGLIDEVL